MEQRLLIDTNIVLEVILKQDKYKDALHVFNSTHTLYLTEFSLHSIFVVSKRNKVNSLEMKAFDKYLSKRCNIIELKHNELGKIFELSYDKELDFDDAHLYYLAKKENLKIITYDKHLLKYPHISVDGKFVV